MHHPKSNIVQHFCEPGVEGVWIHTALCRVMHFDAAGGCQSVCRAGLRLKEHSELEKLPEPRGGDQI